MKFGKRLLAEAARKWAPQYVDYKLLKRCLKRDCATADASGTSFAEAIDAELVKVDRFYQDREARLQQQLSYIESLPLESASEEIRRLRLDAQELTKYAVLNYMAVVKAVKKRNKRLKDVCGDSAVSIQSCNVLQHQRFFYSRALSKIATSAAILEEKLKPRRQGLEVAREYECPICLELLHAPVVLTCCHRFCWGCITTHCAGVVHSKQPTFSSSPTPKDADERPNGEESVYIQAIALAQLHPGFERLMDNPDTGSGSRAVTFDCPMCRKTQILDVEHLSVDHNLNAFVEQLRARRSIEDSESAAKVGREITEAASAISSQQACLPQRESSSRGSAEVLSISSNTAPRPAVELAPLLRPQQPQYHGKLCIVLDLDGTLISSFPPQRAPRLPDSVRTHRVGTGSKLNPHGVFVVERPGLLDFLTDAQQLGELVIFTAGLPDYARPIIAAIDPSGKFFGDRIIYRDGTTASPHYPCVKDLSRLGRDLSKTLLVDDTPLAFLRQPDSGVPVMSFRGDPDDNLLQDAVLPLLQTLSQEEDVREKLNARFGMAAWFATNKFPSGPSKFSAAKVRAQPSADEMDATSDPLLPVRANLRRMQLGKQPLLLCEFDATLVDFNCTERLVETLAPELVPMLVTDPQASHPLSVVNAVLSELRERSCTREQILCGLRKLGSEMPQESVDLLQAARQGGAAVVLFSDANVTFVSNILQGSSGKPVVDGVIAHSAEFVRASSDQQQRSCMTQKEDIHGAVERKLPSHKLQISPCQPASAPHACAHCSCAMCKGLYVQALQESHPHIVLAGGAANSACAVLKLRPNDIALVRSNSPCDQALAAFVKDSGTDPLCQVLRWSSIDELSTLATHALLPQATAVN